MLYPFDPEGSPFGNDYPPGFTKWYLAIIVVLVVIGALALNGCSSTEDHANAILNHCANTAFDSRDNYSETMFQKCVNDSLWTLKEMR